MALDRLLNLSEFNLSEVWPGNESPLEDFRAEEIPPRALVTEVTGKPRWSRERGMQTLSPGLGSVRRQARVRLLGQSMSCGIVRQERGAQRPRGRCQDCTAGGRTVHSLIVCPLNGHCCLSWAEPPRPECEGAWERSLPQAQQGRMGLQVQAGGYRLAGPALSPPAKWG